MSSRYELVDLEKALTERHIGAAIARAEKAAENRFSYLLKANVFNYSDFFIGTHDGDVRSLILQVNDYLKQMQDNGHLLLANIDRTADGFWAYLFQKYNEYYRSYADKDDSFGRTYSRSTRKRRNRWRSSSF